MMFDKMLSDMQTMMKPYQEGLTGQSFKPMTQLMMIQAQALEKIGTEQARFYTECVAALTKQLDCYTQTQDPVALQEAQFNLVQDMQDRIGRLLKNNLDTLSSARDAVTSELEAIKSQVVDLTASSSAKH